MKHRHLEAILFVLTILFLLPSAVLGQTEKGSIVGTVTDANGAAVANATVVVTDLATKTTQTFTTNDDGIYNVPFLTPGNYDVLASAPGFSKSVVNNVVVNVATRERVDIKLKVGDVAAVVEVANEAPLLQSENANVGQVISNQQLTDLPSGNRNVYSFLSLDSTVNGQGVNSSNAEAFRLESAGTVSIGGGRPSAITFKVDGQANNDPTFGTPTITPALETVKEFQLQNNAYSAEFEGFSQVNVATKSGGSRFRGSLFEFIQNDFFQPRNPLAPLDSEGRRGKNKLRFNQFGASVGGPLWTPNFGEGGPIFLKDRTFFFFSYEGLRNNGRGTAFARVLTQAERSGDFSANLGDCIRLTPGGPTVPLLNPNGTPSGQCIRIGQIFDPATTVANPLYTGSSPSAFNPQFIRQPFAGNIIPANRLSPQAQGLINLVQPLPNFTSTSDLNYLGASGSNFLNNQFSIRLDHRISDSDSIYGRFTWQNNQRDTEAVLPYQAVDLQGKGRVFNSSWTHIFTPTLVNEFRLSYLHGEYGQSITEIDPTQFGVGNTPLNTIPVILLTSGGQLSYGGFAGSILETTHNTYQISDNVSYSLGSHSFKAGFKMDFNRFQNLDRIGSNGRLDFNGLFSVGNSSLGVVASRPNSIADFLLGNASSHSLRVDAPARISNTPWAAYFQDDWKINPQLTVNLGLRYEYHDPWADENLGGRVIDLTGEGSVLVRDPEVARLANDPRIVCCADPEVVAPDRNDFAPRIGVAWRPFKGDNMVIRAGYGLFYTSTTQFFHWLYYTPLRNPFGSFTPNGASFQNPAATLSNPFPSSQITPPGGSGISIGIPTAGGVPVAGVNQPVINIFGLGPYDTPTSHQWSVGVQREIMRNMVLDVSYKGSKTKNLPIQWFFNQPTFSSTAANFQGLDPAANPYLRRPYDNFTIGSNIVANVLEAEYNALTVKVDKRFSNGYNFLTTYTWSKSIDQGAEAFSLGQNHAFLPNNLDFNAGRGVSILDIPHRWVTSGTAELPFGKGKWFLNQGGIVNALFGGWRLSGIFTLQSGQPFSPYLLTAAGHTNTGVSVVERGNFGSNTTPFTDAEWRAALEAWRNGARLHIIRPEAISLTYDGVGNIPRNAFRYLFTRRLDLSLAKVTRFSESTSLELRFDMFNASREVLHHPVFHTQVAGANNLTGLIPGTTPPIPIRGSIPGRNLFFLPHTIQVGGRFTF